MKKRAFTLAEVLVTLGIVGVIAAITIPSLAMRCQKYVLKKQFKKKYLVLQQALDIVANDFDYPPNCYYWGTSPYGPATCAERDETGDCKKYTLANGDKLPSDYTGRFSDCNLVKEKMKEVLKVTTICKNKALVNGCIPPYKGNDTILKDNNPDKEYTDRDLIEKTSGCGGWRENAIRNNREAWVLLDGTIILFYSGFQLFAIDVNGGKGPNRWGYDLLPLGTYGDGSSRSTLDGSGCGSIERGGMSSKTLVRDLIKL